MEPSICSNCGEAYAICHENMVRAANVAVAGSDLKGLRRDRARAARDAACCRKCRHG